MLNDETKRKLRELNIGEIIDAIEFQNQDPVTVTLPFDLLNSYTEKTPAYHFSPPPVPGDKARPENTGHTYDPLQPPGKTSVPPFHSFVLYPNQKHTFSQYDIADRVSASP